MDKKRIDESIYKYVDKDIMSNFDHEVEPDAEEYLKNNKVIGDYPALNFHGDVWYEDGQFHCEIWRYHVYIDTISSDTLKGIMKDASDEYGWS